MTSEQFLGVIDQIIFFAGMLAKFTFVPFDDFVVRLLQWGRADEGFIAWARKKFDAAPATIETATENLMTDDPEFEALFDRFKRETGAQTTSTGGIGELISILMQLFAWFKSRQAGAAATPTAG